MKMFGYIGAVVLFIIAAILTLFGVLFILGAFSPQGQSGWIMTGIIIVVVGLVFAAGGVAAFVFTSRRNKQEGAAAKGEVTYNIDLPGNVSMDTMKCQSCGGVLTKDNIDMVNGAPVVTCPFCSTVYQLTEDPKW